MKKTILTFLILCSTITASFAEQVKISVNGLVCDFCARAIEKVFMKKDAVNTINVNLDKRLITINFKQGQSLDDATLTEAITEAGYNIDTITRSNDDAE